MKTKHALSEFNKFLRGREDGSLAKPGDGFAQMLTFYADVRFEDTNLAEDGDMLLFQWGTYDWGNGRFFNAALTRQLIRGAGEDSDIWQLHLTYRFAPSDAFAGLGAGNRWCAHPAQLASFKEFVMNHPVTDAVGTRVDAERELYFECAG